MLRAASALLGGFLVALRAMSDVPPEYLAKSTFEGSQTVILVHVVTSTFRRGDSPRSSSSMDARAKVSVLKSWKGPFSPGTVVHVAPNVLCTGGCGSPFDLQNGEDVLIFTNSTGDPISVGSTMRAAEAHAAMVTLDRVVSEQRELQDPQTDLVRARERNRVMLALKKCFTDASTHPKSEYYYPQCETMDVSILRGTKRSVLIATWGPPTWCQRWDSSGNAEYPSPAGTDCSPDQTPIWSFVHPAVRYSGLWCEPQRNLRCMGLGWVYVAAE